MARMAHADWGRIGSCDRPNASDDGQLSEVSLPETPMLASSQLCCDKIRSFQRSHQADDLVKGLSS